MALFQRKKSPPATSGVKLHIGSGKHRLEGWVNVDIQDIPGVDVVADVTDGLDFKHVQAVYAEHFLEHLEIGDAIDFLLECRRVLSDDGWLRLSTPNLDWVWSTHLPPHLEGEEKQLATIRANRAFYGWRHRFLWTREFLHRALEACGFDEIAWFRYGASGREVFQGLERHETYTDTEDLPHVLVVEARRGKVRKAELKALRQTLQDEFWMHMAD
ncbi:MAG: methyltransferase domain-containing protein [Acidobacteriota bacterium]